MRRVVHLLIVATISLPIAGSAPGINTPTPTEGPCQQVATSNCLSGGGHPQTDCMLEWFTTASTGLPINPLARNHLSCFEGDPRCDADSDVGNGRCTFRIGLCGSNDDPRLESCLMRELRVFEVKRPNPVRTTDPINLQNLLTLESAAGAGGLGVTVARGNVIFFAGQALQDHNLCTVPFDLLVPLRHARRGLLRGSRGFRVVGTAADGAFDVDRLQLECRPSTCGDGVIQYDHEQCDDGNRNGGDGCDPGCQVERPTKTPTPSRTPVGPTATATDTLTPSLTPTAGPPTSTPTVTASPTMPLAQCGNHLVEAGETCDDGNTVTNPPADVCPADCTILTCSPSGTNRLVNVSFQPPAGKSVASITVLLEYPDGTVQIPGSGGDDSVIASVVNLPSGSFPGITDYDYALAVGVASTHTITPGTLFGVDFADCLGALPPTSAAFRCRVTDASDATFHAVTGVSCSATAP